jgi:hypothetical protein
MANVTQGRRNATLVWSAGLLLLGVVFLLDELAVVDVPSVAKWWPVLLLLTGLARFVEAPELRGPGAAFAIVGAVLLLETLDVVDFGKSWPVLLLAGGVALALFAFRKTKG